MAIIKALVEITKASGEVIWNEEFKSEISAHDRFEEIEPIRSPDTFKGLTMNCSEFNYGGNFIGTLRVVAIDDKGEQYPRRELFRYP